MEVWTGTRLMVLCKDLFLPIDVFVFRTDELAKNAKAEVTSWGWTGIWQFEDPSTNYGIFLGERDDGQPCTDAAASAFEMVLSR